MRSLHSDPEEDITIEFSHHSSESLENDMWVWCLTIIFRRQAPSPMVSPMTSVSFPQSYLRYVLIPTEVSIKLLIKKREELDSHVRLHVFLVSIQWTPATTSLIDLIHHLIDRLEMAPSISTTILQYIDSAMDQLSYHVVICFIQKLGWITCIV